jgi:hypothetical protein
MEEGMARVTKEDKALAVEYLQLNIKEGDTLYPLVKTVASSGMSRQMVILIRTDTGIRNISRIVARAQGYRYNADKDCFSISGCGMDMGMAVVYDLSYLLFGKENALKYSWL